MRKGIVYPPLKAHKQETSYGLSFQQQRIRFLYQVAPGAGLFNMGSSKYLKGELDLQVLEKALEAVARRHPSLRTVFAWEDGEMRQNVLPHVDIHFSMVDFSQYDVPEAREKALAFLETEARTPLDLLNNELLTYYLVQIARDEYIFMFNWHHIVTDGLAVQLLWQEIAALYNLYKDGKDGTVLLPLKIHYHDYVAWQEELVQSGYMKVMETYWLQELQGELPVLALPVDFPRPAVQDYKGALHKFSLEAGLVEKLQKYGYFKMTLFSLLFSAYYILLSRYSGQSDIIIGVFFGGRHVDKELDNLLGYVANPAAVRVRGDDNPVIRRLLKKITKKIVDAYNNQFYPMEELVRKINPVRDTSRPTLFQAMFNMQTLPREPAVFHGLEEKESTPHVEVNAAQYELSLFVYESPRHMELNFEYCSSLFKEETIGRVANRYKNILEYILEYPTSLSSEIDLLSKEEKEELLIAFNRTQQEYPAEETVGQVISRQAVQKPGSVVVTHGRRQLSCGRLEEQSNQLAHYLIFLGIAPGDMVGICLEHSIDMVIAILGIWKAGAAYIPIDAKYPSNRIRYMVEDSRVKVLLSRAALSVKFGGGDRSIICPDRDWPVIGSFPAHEPPDRRHSSHFVYVIYTSGSTGKPKGVAVFQRGFANLLHWFIHEFALTAKDSVVLISSLSFDLTQKNIFAPLMSGGKLHLLTTLFHDPAEISGCISRQMVTWLNCTPSVFYSLIGNASAKVYEELATLRYLFLGGEPVAMEKYAGWIASSHFNARIVNTYGPTEGTDVVSFYVIPDARTNRAAAVPIGKPVYNTRLFILGPHLELLPRGIVGEIYISGDCVSAGYIDDIEKTTAKFVANPFCALHDKTLYRTGDLGKYLPDGNIEYIGRNDNQVKIRGFRIELKEIENRINQFQWVKENLVVIREDSSGIKRIAAYVIPQSDSTPNIARLRKHLKKELPEYMIPDTFVTLRHFPLSPNGKVDVNRLPEPGQIENPSDFIPAAPRNTLEEALCRIIAAKVSRKCVGIHDNFFSMGHSLLAVEVITQIRAELGIPLPMYTIFQTPTAAGLAETIMEIQTEENKETRERSPQQRSIAT